MATKHSKYDIDATKNLIYVGLNSPLENKIWQ